MVVSCLSATCGKGYRGRVKASSAFHGGGTSRRTGLLIRRGNPCRSGACPWSHFEAVYAGSNPARESGSSIGRARHPGGPWFESRPVRNGQSRRSRQPAGSRSSVGRAPGFYLHYEDRSMVGPRTPNPPMLVRFWLFVPFSWFNPLKRWGTL